VSVEEEVGRLLHDGGAALAASHLRRLPPRYRECFHPADIALHARLLAEVRSEDPVRLVVTRGAAGETECTVLAFDHPAVFSLICGVLSSQGLDVRSGDVFTSASAEAPAEPERGAGRLRRLRRRVSGGPPERRAEASRRLIVDRLAGVVRSGLEPARWKERVEEALRAVFLLLEGGTEESLQRARSRVNDMVAAALASFDVDVTRGLYPVEISIDNGREGATVMEVVSEDTPFFLYALSSALGLRHLSIEAVRIRTEASRIRDEFCLVDRRGAKIEDPDTLDLVRLSALLTKQFSYFLANSPDPTAAMARFGELVERAFPLADRERWVQYLSDPNALRDLARLLGASDFLWEDFVRLQYESILPLVARDSARVVAAPTPEGLRERLDSVLAQAGGREEAIEALNRFKDAEIYAYDVDHILNPASDHAELGRRLTRLAECVVSAAAALAVQDLDPRHGLPRTVAGLTVPYAIMGLGKLGGEALGYASDIELLLVYQDAGTTDGAELLENGEYFGRLAREVAGVIRTRREGIFRVDLRLRPYGATGPAACSLESFCRYYGRGGDAHSYERLALVSMRCVAGDAAFGERLERLRDEMLYVSGGVDLDALRALRERQAREKDSIRRPNAKFSPGALVDLEYAVQILQVKHGRDHAALRTPKIRDALAALGEAGVVEAEEAERLAAAYGFLRGLINALRMLRGSAVDLYLPEPHTEEYTHLARRMGFPAGSDPARRLHLEFEAQTAEIRSFMQRRFGSEAFLAGVVGSCADLVLAEVVPAELRVRILRRAGLRETERGYHNLKALAGGAPARQLFARVAVLAADVLPRTPDADMALNNWERFMAGVEDRVGQYEALLRQPTRLEILLGIFASSQYLSDTLVRYPAFFDWLVEPVATGRIRRRADIEADLDAFVAPALDAAERGELLRVFKRRELARIGVKDICLGAGVEEVCLEISELADALVGRCLDWAMAETVGAREAGIAVLAFGKLGGRELNYSSDIDLVGVYDDPRPDSGAACSAVLEELQRGLGGITGAGFVYRVDYRLRPYGRSGEIAASTRALARYYRETAVPWELQAALRVRAVAGDVDVGEGAVASVREAIVGRMRGELARPGGRDEILAAVRRQRVAAAPGRGRLARGAVDVKNGVGGIRDVEFIVQALELTGCVDRPAMVEGNTLAGLDLAAGAGLLPGEIAHTLREGYVFLRKVEHYLQVFDDRQTHVLPAEEWRVEHLARCLLGHRATRAEFLARLDETRRTVRSEAEAVLGRM
jgi:[glutamine synthetase] adenylyltransferase / [glutamine synthetase]-adenylyl-L-tyrosine phosphorylase